MSHAVGDVVGVFSHDRPQCLEVVGWDAVGWAGCPNRGNRVAVLIKDGSGHTVGAVNLFGMIERKPTVFHFFKFLRVGFSAGDGVFVVALEGGGFNDGGAFAGGEVGENGFTWGRAMDRHSCSDINGEFKRV